MKNIYKILFSIFLLAPGVFHFTGQAQQNPVVLHYAYLPQFYNPGAMGGNGEQGSLGLVHRQQLADGINMSTTHLHWNTAKRKRPLIFGGNFVYDKNGLINTFRAGVTGGMNLGGFGFGISLGVIDQRFNLKNIYIEDAADQVLLNQATYSNTNLDAGIGLNYRKVSDKVDWQIGYSTSQISGNTITVSELSILHKMYANGMLNASLRLKKGSIQPEILFLCRNMFGGDQKMLGGNADIMARVHFTDKAPLWVSLGTRLGNFGNKQIVTGMNFGVGFTFKNKVTEKDSWAMSLNPEFMGGGMGLPTEIGLVKWNTYKPKVYFWEEQTKLTAKKDAISQVKDRVSITSNGLDSGKPSIAITYSEKADETEIDATILYIGSDTKQTLFKILKEAESQKFKPRAFSIVCKTSKSETELQTVMEGIQHYGTEVYDNWLFNNESKSENIKPETDLTEEQMIFMKLYNLKKEFENKYKNIGVSIELLPNQKNVKNEREITITVNGE